jgi:8-oxo-dGTP pyrophosphatase MutT (NUDIX family)
MPVEKSAGAVIFRRENDEIFYLLLHYPGTSHRTEKDYWDFPKGHIEKGEKIEETVKREVREETGLKDLKFIEGFKKWIKYFFYFQGKKIFKIVTFLLAETKTKKVKISFEHIGYKWLPYQKALEKLTFDSAKEILKKANDYLNSKCKIQNAK